MPHNPAPPPYRVQPAGGLSQRCWPLRRPAAGRFNRERPHRRGGGECDRTRPAVPLGPPRRGGAPFSPLTPLAVPGLGCVCAFWSVNTGAFSRGCVIMCVTEPSPASSAAAPRGPPPARTSGGAGWRARCPAHDDWDASLSIRPDDDGRWPLACRSGCAFGAIVAAGRA